MNPATWLTFSRFVIAPFFAYCFLRGVEGNMSPAWLWAAFGLLVLSELTDAFDGMVARAQGAVTDFGKVFDPAVDSMARLTAFIAFMTAGLIPLWMFLIFLYRDMLLSLLRTVCASRGKVLAARKSGKLKAVIQAAAIFAVLLLALARAHGLTPPKTMAGLSLELWIVGFAAAFTAGSALDYLIPNWRLIDAMMQPREQ